MVIAVSVKEAMAIQAVIIMTGITGMIRSTEGITMMVQMPEENADIIMVTTGTATIIKGEAPSTMRNIQEMVMAALAAAAIILITKAHNVIVRIIKDTMMIMEGPEIISNAITTETRIAMAETIMKETIRVIPGSDETDGMI
jgi:hypothetical protein